MRNMKQIDRGIPPPEPTAPRRPYTERATSWKAMAVGESVFFVDRSSSTISSMMAHAARRHGYKFTQRAQEGGYRVWRIE